MAWTQPTIGSEIAAMVEDPDGGVAILTWQWRRSPTDNGPFTIIPRETAPNYTPEPADDGDYLQAIATYIDTTSEMTTPIRELLTSGSRNWPRQLIPQHGRRGFRPDR